MKSLVSIVKCEDYTPSRGLVAVKEALNLLGGIEQFVKPGQRVLLKPNLVAARPPEDAACTHPAVVEAIAKLVIEAGGLCFLGDCPSVGGETDERYANLLKTTGMSQVIEQTGALPVRFDAGETERELPDAKVFRKLVLTDSLIDTDVLINIPKFKTHGLTRLSGAVKNLFGCIPGSRKVGFHLKAGDDPEVFAQMSVDILRTVRPHLSIMDAIIGMDGQGPTTGRRRTFGLIFASADPVALDSVAWITAGADPMTVPTLRLAAEQGLGVASMDDIEVVGTQPADVRISDFEIPVRGNLPFKVPQPIYRFLRNQLTKSPVFIREKCTDCRSCASICPFHVISGKENMLRVDYSGCIRCYCCQEVCLKEAIYLRVSLFRRTVEWIRCRLH